MSAATPDADAAANAAHPDPDLLALYFRTLVEHASDIVTLMLPDATIRFQSPSGERALGYPTSEIVGLNVFELIHPDDHGRTREILAQGLASPGCVRSTTLRLRHRDGTWRDFECVGKVARVNGLGEHIVVHSRDVTERNAIAARLAESERRFRHFFEEDVAAHVITAVDGSILECNRAFAEMFGFDSPEQARQWNVRALSDLPSRGLPVGANAVASRRVERLRLAMRRRDGQPVFVLASVVAETDEAGGVVRVHAQMLDETAVRTLSSQLEAAHRIESLGQLAGGIAHHFNNILTGVLGHADLALRREPADPALVGHLREIVRAGGRAADLTRRLLAAGRRQFLAPRTVSLHQVVADLEPMLGRVLGDAVELRAVRGHGPANVLVDPGQIEQVLTDLVLNARDAMPGGGVVVISTREESVRADEPAPKDAPPPGRYAVLRVSDDGVGMDEATRERLFQPFFTTKGTGRGSGLGLPTVHGIVHQSGGHIRVESEPGRGSCFHIYLPLHEEERGAEGEKATEEADEPKRPHLLLVEDDESVRTLVAGILSGAGYTVTEAEDGHVALDRLSGSGPPDLIISDLMMPHLSGVSFAQRARHVHPGVPVLFVSGYHEDLVSEDFPREDGVAFLQKPFSPQQLLAQVATMTGWKPAPPA